jgi:hypothetical protein
MEAVFADGVPARITTHDFRRHHLQSFPKLADERYDELIADSIDTVYTMFSGVASAWDLHRKKQVWFEKTVLCYRLLTCWYITDRYPELSSSYTSLNGVPLEQKKIDGVMVKFQRELARYSTPQDNLNPMLGLRSNDFGRKALIMLQTAPRRALLRVEGFV